MGASMNLIQIFARHRVASSLFMAILILGGVWGISNLNVQFFPNFTRDVILVKIFWQGARAEDVETAIAIPLEQSLRNLDGLDDITAVSTNDMAMVFLEYIEGTDMSSAIDKVTDRVNLIRDLPDNAEAPEISHVYNYEAVARILLTGPEDPSELRRLAYRIQDELLDRGLAKVYINGLPNEEMAIQVPSHQLRVLGLSLEEIADRIAAENREVPGGTIGREDSARDLLSTEQRRTEREMEQISLISDNNGRWLTVGDIARVMKRPLEDQLAITFHGSPAVELIVLRTENSDALESARILDQWLTEARETLPPGITLYAFDQRWKMIQGRIELLLKNGLSGLLLVLIILFLFLDTGVAWWIAIGIPTAFFATLAVLYGAGGTLNMMSLFGFIIVLGIIVDDAIVVGENAFTRRQNGEDVGTAAENGALTMFVPVLTSSLTTMATFLPVAFVSGILGSILFDIPFVVLCAIIASLMECFLVLPGHLRHSFRRPRKRQFAIRRMLDALFNRFQKRIFRPAVQFTLGNTSLIISVSVVFMSFCFGLQVSGRIGFAFFPPIESNVVLASASFVPGTPTHQVERFLRHLEQTLKETDEELGGNLIHTTLTYHGIAVFSDDVHRVRRGDPFGSIFVELIASDDRAVRTEEFMQIWEGKVHVPSGMESFSITARRDGHPGSDIEIRLTEGEPQDLKQAAEAIKLALRVIPGTHSIEDDLPYGKLQLVYSLKPQGEALGLDSQMVANQLYDAFEGHLAQVFHDQYDEIEVRVMLPDYERRWLGNLEQMHILTPQEVYVPIESVVAFDTQRGFETLRRDNGKASARVTANIDYEITNLNRIMERLSREVLPNIERKFHINAEFVGRASDQEEGLKDMLIATVYAIALVYIVLAWVFASYVTPFLVMVIIPFGVAGAILGHWIMGIELTILSLVGMLGVAGIVVNDAIILIVFYRDLRRRSIATQDALIEAVCQRLRAVVLTSLTTIGGLSPLLFEDSLQAQFLVPVAVSVCFGEAFATMLVLFLLPAILILYERKGHGRRSSRQQSSPA
jgi:multidrug efflux pump subunit AcrB